MLTVAGEAVWAIPRPRIIRELLYGGADHAHLKPGELRIHLHDVTHPCSRNLALILGEFDDKRRYIAQPGDDLQATYLVSRLHRAGLHELTN